MAARKVRTQEDRDIQDDDLNLRLSLLQQDFVYVKNDVSEVKRGVKKIGEDIANMSYVTPQALEDTKKQMAKDFVSKSDFDKLTAKITPLIWFGGIMATAVVGVLATAIITFILNGGLRG